MIIMAPFLASLIAAIILFIVPARYSAIKKAIFITFQAVCFCAALYLFNNVYEGGIVMMQMASWPAPFGITFVADLFSAIMVLAVTAVSFCVGVFTLRSTPPKLIESHYYSFYNFLITGIIGACLTGDVFNLYVWFEVTLISTFALLSIGSTKKQIEGLVKYLILNLVGTMLFLMAVAMLYGLTGTLNMAHLAHVLPRIEQTNIVTIISVLFMVSLVLKSAIFPFCFWLPSSYAATGYGVSALFAGLLTKLSMYVLIRLFTLLFVQDVSFTHGGIMLWLAVATVLWAGISALYQKTMRKLLSFEVISHMGLMLLGLALFKPLTLMVSVFYLVADMITKTGMFLIAGSVARRAGSGEFKKLGGFYKKYPFLTIMMLVLGFSAAGVPPFISFWPKLFLIQASSDPVVLVTIVLGAVLGLSAFIVLFSHVFWKARPKASKFQTLDLGTALSYSLPIVSLSLISLMGVYYIDFLTSLFMRVSNDLMNPNIYIATVLGGMK